MAARDVFISHSSGDAELARELRAVLETAGYSCWMAPDDIVGHRTWTEQILAAISDSKIMVVLVSAAAQQSEHVSREVNLALGRKRPVMPIRIESVPPEGPLEYLLALVQRTDAFPPPIASHSARILRRLEAILERPQSAMPAERREETGPVDQGTAGAGGGAEAGAQAAAAQATAAPGGSAAEAAAPQAAAAEAAAPQAAAAEAAAAPGGTAAEREATTDPGGPPPIPIPSPAQPASPAAPSPAPSPAPQLRSPADLGPGSVVGAFTIESQLGEGGMATVYRARQEEPRRLVALKVIRSDHAANDTYRRRFLEEKETLAALEHPSIVPIYAAGEADGVLFIAMRLVDGPDLQARIKRQGHLSLRETVQVLEPIADAVDYAHAMGVVHRDLKPSNIILDRDARPYLTDFGLGKRTAIDSQLSMPGMAIGTLDYMAPEQFRGGADPKLAPAIDLYALGCVAFQCLTGQAPFVRDTPDQLMYAHAHEAPPKVTSLRPEYPPVIDSIFAKVLAKDPAVRYGSAREFVADVDRVAAAAASHVTSPVVVPQRGPATQARRWVGRNTALAVGGGAVALVAVVALGAVAIFGPKESPGPTEIARESIVPTLVPTVRPTVRPTVPPPTPPPPTPGFPNEFEADLISILPAMVDTTTCTRFTLEAPTALATVACYGPEGAAWQVVYTLFASEAALDAAYVQSLKNVDVAETTTGCFDLVESNNVWSWTNTQDVTEGRLGCYDWTEGTFEGVQYVWTYNIHNVMARWLTTDYRTGLDYYTAWVTAAQP